VIDEYCVLITIYYLFPIFWILFTWFDVILECIYKSRFRTGSSNYGHPIQFPKEAEYFLSTQTLAPLLIMDLGSQILGML
jgi:hypothetical protein